ncbi:MAG: hypothetical protein A3D28_03825 [Omnitrophica bacterium RIFCSPHIGHO2_02_FULL_63_14]|nr:MAG: hypothetical protein A3D28_03825 [Omnitrophica bacterium RIFCSPHIGHO2_02_FULL_63_14]
MGTTPFRAGELVSHPLYGLCRIQQVETANLGDGRRLYYTFRIGSRLKAKVFVQADEARRIGIRYPLTKVQAQQILKVVEAESPGGDARMPEDYAGTMADLLRKALSQGIAPSEHTAGEASFREGRRHEQAALARAAERATDELAFALHESPVALKKRIYKRTGRRH